MAFSFLRPRANIFLYGPTKKVNNLSIFFLSKHLNFANILACFLVVISVYSGQRRKVCAFTFVGGQSKVSCWIIKLTFAMFAFVSQLLQNRLNGLYKTYFQNSLCVFKTRVVRTVSYGPFVSQSESGIWQDIVQKKKCMYVMCCCKYTCVDHLHKYHNASLYTHSFIILNSFEKKTKVQGPVV